MRSQDEDKADRSLSQTLSRGIVVLETLAESSQSLSAAQVATITGLNRSVVYRLLKTLEHHGLAIREGASFKVGPRLAVLSASIDTGLRSVAPPLLQDLANRNGNTVFIAALDAEDCVTLLTATPDNVITSLVQAPGTRHPATSGAPGKAILSVIPESQWPFKVDKAYAKEVANVARTGLATSDGEVLPGVSAFAVPLEIPGQNPAALAMLTVGTPTDLSQVRKSLNATATEISALL